jgi:arylsulfatase A-like enzyme
MDPHEPYGYFDSLKETPWVTQWLDQYDPSDIETFARRARQRPGDVTDHEREVLVDFYDAYIRYLDTHIGRLFEALEERRLWDETQVFITADHGEKFGEHGQYYHQNKPYDELIHVPLLAKSPSLQSATVERQVRHIDIAPTILEAYDSNLDSDLFDGTSLQAVSCDRDVIASSCDRPYFDIASRSSISIRRPDWKLFADPDGLAELYNLEADPEEATNRLADYPDRAATLWSELEQHVELANDSGVRSTEDVLSDEDEDVQSRLRDLGYME